MLLKFIIALGFCLDAALFLDAGICHSKPKEDEKTHVAHGSEFQAINSLLSERLGSSPPQPAVVQILGRVIDIIESVGPENAHSLKESEVAAEMETLLDEDARVILDLSRNLIKASNSCQDESINFLAIVIDLETFEDQSLNNYARSLLNGCWVGYVQSYSRAIDVALGKLKAPLTSYILKLIHWCKKLQKQSASDRTAISIDGIQYEVPRDDHMMLVDLRSFKPTSRDTSLLGKAFKRIALDEAEETRELEGEETRNRPDASVLFNDNFIEPCKELSAKLTGRGENFDYGKYVKESLGSALQSRARDNKRLDIGLHVMRICKFLTDNEGTFLDALLP